MAQEHAEAAAESWTRYVGCRTGHHEARIHPDLPMCDAPQPLGSELALVSLLEWSRRRITRGLLETSHRTSRWFPLPMTNGASLPGYGRPTAMTWPPL